MATVARAHPPLQYASNVSRLAIGLLLAGEGPVQPVEARNVVERLCLA